MWQVCFLPAVEFDIYKRNYIIWKNVQRYFSLSLFHVYICWICKVCLNCKKKKSQTHAEFGRSGGIVSWAQCSCCRSTWDPWGAQVWAGWSWRVQTQMTTPSSSPTTCPQVNAASPCSDVNLFPPCFSSGFLYLLNTSSEVLVGTSLLISHL